MYIALMFLKKPLIIKDFFLVEVTVFLKFNSDVSAVEETNLDNDVIGISTNAKHKHNRQIQQQTHDKHTWRRCLFSTSNVVA